MWQGEPWMIDIFMILKCPILTLFCLWLYLILHQAATLMPNKSVSGQVRIFLHSLRRLNGYTYNCFLCKELLHSLIMINYFKCNNKTNPHSRYNNNLVTATHCVMILLPSLLEVNGRLYLLIWGNLLFIDHLFMSEAHLNINCNT